MEYLTKFVIIFNLVGLKNKYILRIIVYFHHQHRIVAVGANLMAVDTFFTVIR